MKIIFLISFFYTFILANQTQIFLGSFSTKLNALKARQDIKNIIKKDIKFQKFITKNSLKIVSKKYGKTFIVTIEPLNNVVIELLVLNQLKKMKFKNAYALELSSKIKEKTLKQNILKTYLIEIITMIIVLTLTIIYILTLISKRELADTFRHTSVVNKQNEPEELENDISNLDKEKPILNIDDVLDINEESKILVDIGCVVNLTNLDEKNVTLKEKELDIDIGLNNCDNDKKFYNEVLTYFVSTYSKLPEKLQEILVHHKMKDASQYLLDFSESARDIGATNISDMALGLKDLIANPKDTLYVELLKRYTQALQNLLKEIKEYN